jgi:hypothetical protein
MPALNFQTQFAAPILAGSKPFTLRALRKDGRDPQAGQPLYMFTAMRTKKCKKFAEKPCRFAVTIKLAWNLVSIPTIGDLISEREIELFSRLDGFENYAAFCAFHKIAADMAVKQMRLIAWVTREELKTTFEMNRCYKPGICHCPACWLERQT